MATLPMRASLPRVKLEVLEDCSPPAVPGYFLRMRRYRLRNRYEDGSVSRPFHYDLAERQALDAVGTVLWRARAGRVQVCLRGQLRPPLAFRGNCTLPLPDDETTSCQWEIPAGLVEPSETGRAGLLRCAVRECWEETGLRIAETDLRPLGTALTLSAGVIAEKIYLYRARAFESDARGTPISDGSPVEEHAPVEFFDLEAVFEAIAQGEITDMKTELALRRFAALDLGSPMDSQHPGGESQ